MTAPASDRWRALPRARDAASSLWLVIALTTQAACTEYPYEVHAEIFTESDGAELEYQGQLVSPDRVGRHVVETVFDSFEDAREEGLRLIVRDAGHESTVDIPLGTCADTCPSPCELGPFVRQTLSLEIRQDLTLMFSGTTCWDSQGRAVGYIVSR